MATPREGIIPPVESVGTWTVSIKCGKMMMFIEAEDSLRTTVEINW